MAGPRSNIGSRANTARTPDWRGRDGARAPTSSVVARGASSSAWLVGRSSAFVGVPSHVALDAHDTPRTSCGSKSASLTGPVPPSGRTTAPRILVLHAHNPSLWRQPRATWRSVLQQSDVLVALEPLRPAEKFQFEDEAEAGDLCPG